MANLMAARDACSTMDPDRREAYAAKWEEMLRVTAAGAPNAEARKALQDMIATLARDEERLGWRAKYESLSAQQLRRECAGILKSDY